MPHHVVADIDAPELERVSSDTTIENALERMFDTGSPQLGVTNADELIGVVSHRDITRVLHLSNQINQDSSVLEKSVTMAVNRSYQTVRPDDELFVLFDRLADSPYVVIEGNGSPRVLRDVGLHQFLKEELEEFLLIEEIERTIRDIIRDTIDDDLESLLEDTFESQDLRTPTRLEECSFRHYSIFVSAHWDTFEPRFEHKQDFVRELIDRVGDLRNQMFHFRESHEADTLDTDFIEFAREHLDYIYAEKGS